MAVAGVSGRNIQSLGFTYLDSSIPEDLRLSLAALGEERRCMALLFFLFLLLLLLFLLLLLLLLLFLMFLLPLKPPADCGSCFGKGISSCSNITVFVPGVLIHAA